MLEQVLLELHNWFRARDSLNGIHPGRYAVSGGSLTLPFLQPGQYFRILGSLFNDGLHQYGPGPQGLRDEAFDGAVWALAIPEAVVELAGEIAAYQERYKDALGSPYQAEAFGGYSYSKADGAFGGWQAAFRARLDPYRRLREL